MTDTKSTLTWLLKDQVSATAKKISSSLDTVGVKAKGTSSWMSKLGVATGGLITPTSLLSGGLFALGGFMVKAGQAAADEEINVAKLTASLKANIVGSQGDSAAIEEQISKREDLSFSDDDLRASLALLVAATHDVGKAFDIQSTAMDLARFKGISLQDATDALTRVEGGQYRALKGLGIVLKDGATQTDALAAVQLAAAGQAEQYSNTTQGALDRLKIKFHDLEEQAGLTSIAVFDFFDPPKSYSGATLQKALNGINVTLETLTFHLINVQNTLHEFGKIPVGINAPSTNKSGKASGGPVMAGQAYTVGEHGPETLVMGSGNGTVVPHGGSGGFTIQGVSAAQIVDMVDRGLYFKLNRASPSAVRK